MSGLRGSPLVDLPLAQRDVPEVHVRPGAEALDLLAPGVQTEVVAEAHARGVLEHEDLHALPQGGALLRVELAPNGLEELVLLRVAPPAGPLAEHDGVAGRLRLEDEGRAEDVVQLRLVPSLDDGGPV